MAVAQPDVVDLCFSSEENESSLEEEDSSYDSILVLSQSDDPLPEVPWRFGRAKRNVGSMDKGWAMYIVRCIVCAMFWNFLKHR